MDKVIPKIKEKNSVNSYINEKILKLQKKRIKYSPKYIILEENGH